MNVFKILGSARLDLLDYSREVLKQILPHVEISKWGFHEGGVKQTTSRLINSDQKIELTIEVPLFIQRNRKFQKKSHFQVQKELRVFTFRATLNRKPVPRKISSIHRIPQPTFNSIENEICLTAAEILNKIFSDLKDVSDCSLIVAAVRTKLAEVILSRYLKKTNNLNLDLEHFFDCLHELAEQTYENKPFTFGCLITVGRSNSSGVNAKEIVFPKDYFRHKKFRYLSDGFKTAYRVTGDGQFLKFEKLVEDNEVKGEKYFPEWSRPLATSCLNDDIGVCLTRQGDICIFVKQSLVFTYRQGKWQYWNHEYLISMLNELAKTRRVSKNVIKDVVRAVYQSAIDISFKRTGALFVILNNRKNLPDIVRKGDAIGDHGRHKGDKGFDVYIEGKKIQKLPKAILAELASLDGAVVINNHGEIKAYNSVLKTKKVRRLDVEQGSRGKAAVVSSYLGWAVKISSDGGIKVYVRGTAIIEI
jgi:DNA integrity scanning protein DisA with diadenylate cyclase activity